MNKNLASHSLKETKLVSYWKKSQVKNTQFAWFVKDREGEEDL